MSTILVIDDSKSNAQLVKIALEANGYDVVCIHNGHDGLAFTEQYQPDLIILDLRLPGSRYDGWELIGIIRENPTIANTPIIVTSVEINANDRQRAYEAGCDVYFAKPFSVKALREQIMEYIGTP